MSNFTGRRNTGNASRLGKSLLEGLSALGTALADGPKLARIEEIDNLVTELLQEQDHLIAALIEPGSLTVSEDYDPKWRKSPSVQETSEDGIGRLTECEGRNTRSLYHDAHPACPYVDSVHNAHEFTLRD